MRTFILCLLLLLMTGVAFAGDGHVTLLRLHLREIVGLISFGALGAMLLWVLRK